MRARTVAVVSLALLVRMGLPALAAVPTNVDTSVRLGNEAEDAIAINPTNPQNIVVMSTLTEAVAGLFEGVSFDGGATWTRQVIGVSGQLGAICCDEQLAWDAFGNLWMTYLINGDGNIPIALSIDGGVTFTKVTEIVPVKGGNGNGPAPKRLRGGVHNGTPNGDQPSISVGAGSVWVSYASYPHVVVQASGAPVTGLGAFGAFSAPESVPTSNGHGNFGDTAVGPEDQVMVTYQDQTNGNGGSHIYTAVDPDGLGPAGFGTPVLLARSRVGGFDKIPAQPDRSIDAEASLGWDRSGGPHAGRVYAIWTQEVKNESDNTDTMLQWSDDDGVTWSRAVRLNDDTTKNSQFNPALAVDQTTGDVGVSWYDARLDLGKGGPGDTDGVPNDDVQIWATFSTYGGVTFAPNFAVSAGTSNAADTNTTFDYGDYTHAAFQSGTFVPAWSDDSNSVGGNPDGTLAALDLYVARVAVP